MNEDAKYEELIEQYLMGELSGELLDEFQKRLVADDQFRLEVDFQKAIVRNIKSVGRKEWAIKLQDIHNQFDNQSQQREHSEPLIKKLNPTKSQYQKKYILAIAASILVIISSTTLILTLNNKPDSERLFISYYKPYPNLEQNTRTIPSSTPSERKLAFEAYNSGDYAECIRRFKNILADGEDEMVLFYLGNAYLSADKAAEAETTFKNYLIQYKEFKDESKWYLSLSYLKQGKIEDATKLLNEFAGEKNDYTEEAKEILKNF